MPFERGGGPRFTPGSLVHLQRLAGNGAAGKLVSATRPATAGEWQASKPTESGPPIGTGSAPDSSPLTRREASPPPNSPMVQRQIPLDLPTGRPVFDITGARGTLQSMVSPWDTAYWVNFPTGMRKVESADLFLTDPTAGAESEEADPEGGDLEIVDEDAVDAFDGGALGDEAIAGQDGGGLLGAQHGREERLIREAKNLKKHRYGKSLEGRGLGEVRSPAAVAKSFGKRAAKSMVVKPDRGDFRGGYSDRGTLGAAHGGATKALDATIGQPGLTPIEALMQAPISAAAGTNRREGRTLGRAAVAEQKVGHVFSAFGNFVQMVPVVGAFGALATGVGTYLQEHSAGGNKRQALVKAMGAAASGAVAGLIPGYGTYSGFISMINDCRKLFSKVDVEGDPEYAHALLQRMAIARDTLLEMQELDNPPPGIKQQIAKLHKQIAKIEGRYEKEMLRRGSVIVGRKATRPASWKRTASAASSRTTASSCPGRAPDGGGRKLRVCRRHHVRCLVHEFTKEAPVDRSKTSTEISLTCVAGPSPRLRRCRKWSRNRRGVVSCSR